MKLCQSQRLFADKMHFSSKNTSQFLLFVFFHRLLGLSGVLLFFLISSLQKKKKMLLYLFKSYHRESNPQNWLCEIEETTLAGKTFLAHFQMVKHLNSFT